MKVVIKNPSSKLLKLIDVLKKQKEETQKRLKDKKDQYFKK